MTAYCKILFDSQQLNRLILVGLRHSEYDQCDIVYIPYLFMCMHI
jgi:hypothetical protein